MIRQISTNKIKFNKPEINMDKKVLKKVKLKTNNNASKLSIIHLYISSILNMIHESWLLIFYIIKTFLMQIWMFHTDADSENLIISARKVHAQQSLSPFGGKW